RALIAVDTNVLFDLADEVEDVADAVQLIRRRLHEPELLIPPTVREELAEEALHGEDFQKREMARRAFQLARTWKIQPVELLARQHDAAGAIGRRLRGLGLLPHEEVNDGLIIGEAALLGCSMLLTSDDHLRSMDFARLAFELQ